MPGLVGIITKSPGKANESDLSRMIDCMLHEPFYISGTYHNEKLGCYIGWVCIKNSFADCLPIFNENKDIVLLFGGENFMDRDDLDHLRRQGHKFDSATASSLVHLYEENENDFFRNLNGWFHGTIIDLRQSKVILFNDRYGMQRIYYHENDDAFIFSSEAKSLLRLRPELREIDMKSLGQFISCGCTLQNRTLFRNIFSLPGAAIWEFRNDQDIKKGCYFSVSDWESQPVLQKEVFYQEFKNIFKHILPRYFDSDMSIGISLTGGLDTRMIMAHLDLHPDKFPCYTFGSMYRDTFDVRIAREIAAACLQTHQVVELEQKFLAHFADYAEKTIYVTDGHLDVTGAAEIYANRLARQIAPVRMTGDFGGELLRNVRVMKAANGSENLFYPDFKNQLSDAISTLDDLNNENNLSFTLFKGIPWMEYSRLACEQSQLILRTPFMDNDLVRLTYQAPAEVKADNEISLRLITDGSPVLGRIKTDRGISENSNAFWGRLFYEFLFKAEYCYNYGMPQWLAKVDHPLKALHLERLFLGRHKFHHFRLWFRDELSAYVREILLDERTMKRAYLNKTTLEEIVQSHTTGYRNYTTEISKMLTLELIQRHLIERN